MAERNRGTVVTAAGTGINLALGVLYAWSIFKEAIRQSIEAGGEAAFRWDPASLNDPYALCCLVFAFSMIVAGRCQDSLGPRLTAVIGGVLVGAGFVWISQSNEYGAWLMGFGVLVGAGIAFGYSAATPPAMKWYPPNQTGRIAGIVVSGFGLASVYIAPLARYLMDGWGLANTMLILGVGFFLVVTGLSLFLVNPPAEYHPGAVSSTRRKGGVHQRIRELFVEPERKPSEMLREPSFWLLWVLYFIGAGAGLMVIGSVAGMAKRSLGEAAFLAVVMLAVGNAGGRLVAGVAADRIGPTRTLTCMFVFQAVLMFVAVPVTGVEHASAVLLVLVSSLIGFNYGANLALFPALTKDLGGIKHFGVNYGLVFTAWGVGGFVMSRASQALAASTGSFRASFLAAGCLLVAGALLALKVRDRKAEQVQSIRARLEGEAKAA
jgi:nitrate/nitrite transporter NarK